MKFKKKSIENIKIDKYSKEIPNTSESDQSITPLTKVGNKNLGWIVFVLFFLLYIFSGKILSFMGNVLVKDQKPVKSEAVIVLSTGIEYYPRLIEAARLFKAGYVKKVVINGDRETEILRRLKKKGFKPCCPWYENSIRILSILGVPRKNVLAISVKQAYDTITEAFYLGGILKETGIKDIIITTSKYHTRRAYSIWKSLYSKDLKIRVVAAHYDPFSPKKWWHNGRHIKLVLAEYGGWLYYLARIGKYKKMIRSENK